MATQKLIIIGSGPAGYTAAIYAARAELQPLMFTGPEVGGQLTTTTEVENYPGFPEGIQGPAMMQLLRKQAERFGTQIVEKNIKEVDFSSRPFVVKTDSDEYQAEAVIITTGATATWLNVPGEKEYKGRGVSACATCDGFFFRGKDILIVGGGDTAMEEADFLTKFASKVTIVHRRDELRASQIMQDRVQNNPKIEILWNSEVQELLGDGQRMTGAKIFNNQTNATSEVAAGGIFVAIGRKPNTEFLKGHVELDAKGYITVKPGSTYTSIEGVFAAGDVADPHYRQAIVAAGTGCMAALDAEKWLANN
ncbi:thioredoxin-disulfide reductase [Patescibacteria group bacterium]|nr:thioredoxin-disulfide reductase [Patescibacteria group bacterium]MBU1705314.1 thioredoxin-disulfide reductase [Patescibacteria group bacterium]